MSSSRGITALICFNLGLVGAIALLAKRQSAPASVHSQTKTVFPVTAPGIVLKARNRSVLTPDPARFAWELVESKDYKTYIANLRAIQCPEETIQDIIIAAINQEYAAKEASLKLRPYHIKPWEDLEKPGTRNWAKLVQLRDLLQEKRALVKELLGIDLAVELPLIRSEQGNERFESALNNLPEEKRDAVRAIQEKFWIEFGKLQERTMSQFDSEDRAAYQR